MNLIIKNKDSETTVEVRPKDLVGSAVATAIPLLKIRPGPLRNKKLEMKIIDEAKKRKLHPGMKIKDAGLKEGSILRLET